MKYNIVFPKKKKQKVSKTVLFAFLSSGMMEFFTRTIFATVSTATHRFLAVLFVTI